MSRPPESLLMPGVAGGFSGSPLIAPLGKGPSHPSADVGGPLGGSSSSESVDVRSMKIVLGLSAAGILVVGLPSDLCCPVLLRSLGVGSSWSPTDSLSRLMPPVSSVDAALHAPASAFLCFRPPRLLFLLLGMAALEPSGAALFGGEAGCVDALHGLSMGADQGSHGDTYPPPLLARTPLAVEPPSCFLP